jgi:hypothetical protein
LSISATGSAQNRKAPDKITTKGVFFRPAAGFMLAALPRFKNELLETTRLV